MSDEELIARGNAGDATALDALYRRHRDFVLAVALRATGHPDDALDVLQDAFVGFFARFPGFTPTGSVRGYLFTAVQHLAVDRARRRRPTIDVETVQDELPAGEGAGPDALERRELLRRIGALPAGQRDVLLLRFADDLSLGQIAEVLGIALGTVKSRLHNALQALGRWRRTQ